MQRGLDVRHYSLTDDTCFPVFDACLSVWSHLFLLKWPHGLDHTYHFYLESCRGPQSGRRRFSGILGWPDPLQTYSRCRGLMVHVSWWDCEEHLNELRTSLGWSWACRLFSLRHPPSSLQMEGPVSCAKVPEHIQSPVVHEENDVPATKVVMPHRPWTEVSFLHPVVLSKRQWQQVYICTVFNWICVEKDLQCIPFLFVFPSQLFFKMEVVL